MKMPALCQNTVCSVDGHTDTLCIIYSASARHLTCDIYMFINQKKKKIDKYWRILHIFYIKSIERKEVELSNLPCDVGPDYQWEINI